MEVWTQEIADSASPLYVRAFALGDAIDIRIVDAKGEMVKGGLLASVVDGMIEVASRVNEDAARIAGIGLRSVGEAQDRIRVKGLGGKVVAD